MSQDNKTGEGIAAVLAVAMVLLLLLLGGGGIMAFRYSRIAPQALADEMRARTEAERAHAELQALLEAQGAQEPQQPPVAKDDQAELRLVAWNVESGGNDPVDIARQLADLGPYDVYGLTEVHPANTSLYTAAIGPSYKSLVTVTGGAEDRMMIVHNADRLEELEHAELEAHDGVRMNDVEFKHCSPLMAKFRDKQSGVEFLLVLNHLARGDAEFRQEQAKALRLWAADQELPIIGIGDYNFDYDFPTQKGNAAFDEFLADDTWHWVQPSELVDTNWYDGDGDGANDYPDSCLDFTFVAGLAKQWESRSRVIVRDGDFPDDDKTSDHRPVDLVVVPR